MAHGGWVGVFWAQGARIALVAGVAALAGLVYLFDPSTHAFYPVCRFHEWTGWNCPGCGATRALHALLHGRVVEAMHDNILLTLGLPLVLGRLLWFRGRRAALVWPAHLLWFGLVVAVLFAILRNLPAFAFLSPTPTTF